ncbi:MAG: ATP-binding cassette domain-containing protein [Anaerolineae bacterium]|nr:ATP-binding cassette domain-containing protein [Anaerolineae bacterium]
MSRVFSPAEATRLAVAGRGLPGFQVDRAFAERVAVRTREEAAGRGAHGEILALDHVNLTVPDGQTIAVLGPSGCGKSTLLRVVAGLDTGYTGTVYYDDRDVRDIPPGDRYIGMVFQNYALYPHFPGRGNLRFFFQVRKAPDAEAAERIRITAEIMGIGFDELLERKPGTLSGGQQQRLAIGRAIVRNPRLFLFDEPLSNLDAKLRMQTRVEIKRLLRRFGITALYVTHDQEEAVALADQIAVMREGRIEQVGPYNVLRDDPANAFVAGFLGRRPMNLLPGLVRDDGQLQLGEAAVPLPAAGRSRCAPGQAVILGVRPEAGRLLLGRPAGPDEFVLAGEVEAVEPDYVHRTLAVGLRAGELSFWAIGSLEEWVRPGERVAAAFPTHALYFFAGRDGRRIA